MAMEFAQTFPSSELLSYVFTQAATAFQQKGDFPNAAKTGRKSLALDADLAASIHEFEEAIRLRPSWPEAYNYLGVALARKGEAERAVITFQQALKLNPQYHEAQENLASTLKQIGGSKPAVVH